MKLCNGKNVKKISREIRTVTIGGKNEQNDANGPHIILEPLEIWVSELLSKVKDESPGKVTVSG